MNGSHRYPVSVGLAGSLLVALGGVGVGALPRYRGRIDDPVAAALGLARLHTSAMGRALCTAAVGLGVALLLLGWARLPQQPWQVLRAAALWSLPLLVAPPMFSRDVYAYVGQGQLVAHGLDPYVLGPAAFPGRLAASVAGQYATAPAPYGPVFLRPASWVVELTGERLVPGVLGIRLLAVLGLALLAWALPPLAVAHGMPAGRALWLGLANPLVLLHGVAGGHNDALMAGLLVAGLAVATRPGRWPLVAGACLVTLGGLVKAPALVALAFLALVSPGLRTIHPGRAWAAIGTVLAAVGTALAATTLTGLSWGWLDTVAGGVAGPNLFSPVYGASRALAAITGAEPTGVLHACSRFARAIALLISAGLLLRARQIGAVRALGLALIVLVLLAPAVQPWYLLWGLPLLAASAGPRTVRGLAAASAVLCLLVLPSGRPLLQGPTWGLPVLLAIAAAALAGRPSLAGSRT